ncbi:MAG: hypothetical protein HY721_16865, partial [Planctomycetes bacterium]|nr:hypothetical protein [Planctomycetota bacterium]
LKVPDHVGFDAFAHLDYIRHVAERRSIPLATEGWQMFQSPLYYLLSAPLHSLFAALFEPATAARLLRVVPLAAGAAQVELCHRALRLAFPARPDLRILGTLAGGLLPMNLYGSQAVGNEPLAAALSGLALVLALAVLRAERAPGARLLAALGLALGLALLAKVTALLLVPVVLGAVGWRARRDAREGASAGSGLRRGAASAALVLGVAALASGWYYGRNWIALGKPFFGGWDPERGIVWWQDPAWRTPGDILRFGECLARPVFAAAAGFWDGLYSTLWADGYLSSVISFEHRPPWSYGLMLSGVLLALLPAAAILLGTAAAFRRSSGPARDAAALSLAAVLVHLAAMVALFASVPIYSTAKATYMAGVTPGIAILAASGLDLLARRPLARAAVHGGLACWAAAAYGAYFVL